MKKGKNNAMGKKLTKYELMLGVVVKRRQEAKAKIAALETEVKDMNLDILGLMDNLGVEDYEDGQWAVSIQEGRETRTFRRDWALDKGVDAAVIDACFEKKKGDPVLVVRAAKKGKE